MRAAAEERLMLMERVEHIARIEKDLRETEAELEGLRTRRGADNPAEDSVLH